MSREHAALGGSQHSKEVASETAAALRALQSSLETTKLSVKMQIDELERRFAEKMGQLDQIVQDFEVVDQLVRTGFYGQRPLIEVMPQLERAVEKLRLDLNAVRREFSDDLKRREEDSDLWRFTVQKSARSIFYLSLGVIALLLLVGTLMNEAPEILRFLARSLRLP